jgi:hypothetical protein
MLNHKLRFEVLFKGEKIEEESFEIDVWSGYEPESEGRKVLDFLNSIGELFHFRFLAIEPL